jgi:hypothetical protein
MGEIVFKITYQRTDVDAEGWMLPFGRQSLEDFQMAVASAEAWEFMGLISIQEIHEEAVTGRRLIDGLKFRRLA